MLQQAQSPQALEAMSRQGQSVLKEIEQCGKPIVAAIKGVCMGGGLEVGEIILFIVIIFIHVKY